MFSYYDASGEFVSDHRKPSVAEKKLKKGGFVIDSDDFEVTRDGDRVIIKTIPGTYVSVKCYNALSNSAYHRCGSGTSWYAFYIEHKGRVVASEDGLSDDDVAEFRGFKIPSVRADKTFDQQIKVPKNVEVFWLACGKKGSYASVISKFNGKNEDFSKQRYSMEDIAPDLVVPEHSIEWDGEPRVFDTDYIKAQV